MASTITTSIVTGGTNSHATTSAEANQVATDFVTQGVIGTISNTAGVAPTTGAFAVNAQGTPAMFVDVTAGNAYISATPSGQVAQVLSVRMTTNYTSYAISSNSSGSTKYDWIYLKVDPTKANNPASDASDVTALYTSRSSSNSTDNGSPPTYGILLAVVTVANGASSITGANITDKRSNAFIASTQTASSGWATVPTTLSYNANNGNKEFVITTASDISSLIAPGMRLQVTRGTTPPTQCMSFTAASSQYATKASPSGITFTSTFTCEAWIYLNSYTGGDNVIINHSDWSTGGFSLNLDSNGRVRVFYGASSNFTDFLTYQAIPLKRWVHVAGVVTSLGSKTGAIYINGQLTPSFSALTAATTLAQPSTDLRVGAQSSASAKFFDGYMSEVRVWSTNQSAASIQNNMAINLTGSESNLVALYQGNGAWTDSTSNANTLTPSGSAINNQASNPYRTTEYAEVISTSSSTLTVRAISGTIPNMTLANPQYSSQFSPYGWPGQHNVLAYIPLGTSASVTNTTSPTQVGGLSATVTVPAYRTIEVELVTPELTDGSNNNTTPVMSIWDGTVGSGTSLAQAITGNIGTSAASRTPAIAKAITYPSGTGAATSKTYNASIHNTSGTSNTTLTSTTSGQTYLIVRLV